MTQITTKNSSTGAAVPATGDLVQGELAVNVADKKLYTKDAGGAIVELGINPTTIDINAGTIDGTTIGATTPSTGVFTNVTGTLLTAAQPNITSLGTITSLVATTADINGGTIDGTVIGGTTTAAISGTTGTFSGEITANGGIALGDADKATFGASDDLQLFHDGSNSYLLENGLGNLNVQATGSTYIKSSDGTLTSAQFTPQTEVRLFYNNDQKFRTTSTGCDITGTATLDGLTVDTAQGSISIPTNTSSLNFNRAGSSYIRATDSAGSFTFITGANNFATQRLNIANNGDISFYEDTGTTAKLVWDASAESLQIGSGNSSVKLSTFDSNKTDIAALTNNSDFGGLLEGGPNGSLVVGIQDNDSTDGFYILSGSGNYMTDATYDRVVFKADASGNVGIGTSSPSRKLTIQGGAGDTLPVRVIGGSGTTTSGIEFQDATTTADYKVQVGSIGDALYFRSGGAERIRIDSSGNVGIGTSSPQATLDISSGAGSDTFPILKLGPNSAFGHTVYDSSSTGDLVVKRMISGTETETIRLARASGNVGIGTSLPTSKLHLYKTGTSDNVLQIQNGQDAYASILALTANNDGGSGYNSIVSSTNGGTQHWKIWGGGSASTMAFSTGGAERMRIGSSGNVGIGTSLPSAVLEVRGVAPDYTLAATTFWGGTTNNDDHNGIMLSSYGNALGGSVGSNLTYANSATPSQTNTVRSSGEIQFGNTTTDSRTSDIKFGGYYKGTTSYIERMRINASGNVGIGTSSPSQALDVVGSIEVSDGIYLGGTGAANKLDDYEEGTWTPTLIGSTSGSATLTITTNSYTKIGNTVRLDCYLASADVTGLSGSIRLGGLPFNASGYTPVSITHCTLFSFDESDGVGGFTENGGTYVNLVFGSSSASIPHTSANATSGSIMATIIYKTNS